MYNFKFHILAKNRGFKFLNSFLLTLLISIFWFDQKLFASENSDQLDVLVEINYRAEPIANPIGGIENSSSLLQGLWLELGLGKGIYKSKESWLEIDHWSFSSRLAIVRGNGNYYQQVGAVYPLQTMTSAGQWLTEAVIKREPGNGTVEFKTGIFTLNPDFMDSEIFNYFVHSAINNTFNEEVLGVPIAPLAGTGVLLGYGNPLSSTYGNLKIAAFNIMSPNQFGNSLSSVSSPPSLSGNLAVIQWQKRFSIGNSELPNPGILIGGYWANSYSNSTSIAGNNRTLYGSLTLPLYTNKTKLGDNRIWLAGRMGLDPEKNTAPTFAGLGFLKQGLFYMRPDDITGLAYVTTGFSPDINPGLTQETVFELNHLIQINNRIKIRPFIQLILNPGGTSKLAPIIAPGVQFAVKIW